MLKEIRLEMDDWFKEMDKKVYGKTKRRKRK